VSIYNRTEIPGPGARVVIVARFSTNQQNPLGADDQIRVLTEDCERQGWVVIGAFKDEGKSGRSIKKRTGYLEAMAMAAAGEVDVVAVFQLDRLGRDARELHDAKNRLEDANVVIFTHDKGVMGRLEFALYAEMAQIESDKFAERTNRGRLAAAERGKFLGDAPYGYELVPERDENGEVVVNRRGVPVRKLALHSEASKVVLRVNLDFDAGLSPHQIAVALTREGVPTPEGGPIWHPNTIVGTKRSLNGLLRNPLNVGRYIHGKVRNERDPKTGELKKRKANAADMIEHDRPDLRIVPQDVWDRNQERLAARPPSKLRDRRRPSYPLSGLVKCAVCAGSYVQVSTTMGCSAHRLKACSNNRRVRRQDLEQAVLRGLTQRLAQPDVIGWFIPQYCQERGPATDAAAERRALAVQKLADVNDEINSIRKQLKLDPKPKTRQFLNDELEPLLATKAQFEREVARPASPPAAKLTTEFVLERFEALLENLGGALEGDERDAARARDIIRSLITSVTVEPFDGYGGRPDGRGGKGLRVYVEGEISRLVDRATLETKIMHVRGAGDMHDLPLATFWFYVDLFQPQTPEEQQLWRDVGLIGRMLDDADWPILFSEMIDAMNDRDAEPSSEQREADETRARIALAQYRRGKWARAIRIGGTHGWVWAERAITDDEWRERFHHRDAMARPIGILRLGAPEGAVIKMSHMSPNRNLPGACDPAVPPSRGAL